ncbi:MAG: trypsin-like peptidase domain-containing protein [Dehalococcoidia bacterium]
MRIPTWLVFLILLGLLFSACRRTAEAPLPTPASTGIITPTLTPQPSLTPTPTPTPTPAPTPTPTLELTLAPLTAAEIFAVVSPSIAFIETPAFTGSGVLIEGGYVVTNAHVVWPFQEVRVVFPDGSEYLDAPVLNWDLMGDIAVIGPLETAINPVELVDAEDLIIGSDVYLIGYPGEAEEFPQPTITGGILSRLREWEPIEMTYFQTDAIIAGGQSGGVLVSEDGEVIGISGFYFSEAGYGLVASGADVLPRAERLIAGEDVAGLGDRRVPLTGGRPDHAFTLRNLWDEEVYVINERAGTLLDIELEGENDGAFFLGDVFGVELIFVDETFTGLESGAAVTEIDVPYFLSVGQWNEATGTFQVRSNRSLIPLDDADDGITVAAEQTILASMDYPGDFDYFVINLEEGDTIVITVDSPNFDPYLQVDYLGATADQVAYDDDSGGGLFGLNSELVYKTPHSGTYFITVDDVNLIDIGGYFLTVAEAPPGATISPTVPQPTPTRTLTDSPFGTMAVYESVQYPFTIQYPADWLEQGSIPEAGITDSFVSEQGVVFSIVEEDMVALGFGQTTLEEYVDAVLSVLRSNLPDLELISREQILTGQGSPAEVIFLSYQAGLFKAARYIYMHEDTIAFNATYEGPKARYEELEPLIEYSLGTFEVTE